MMRYNRVLLKLSGESMGGDDGKGLDEAVIGRYAKEISDVVAMGTEVAVVIGGGNIFRGLSGTGKGFDRVRGEQMGMLATVINSIALSLFLKDYGVESEVFTATPMEPFARYYVRDKAALLMKSGGVAIIAGGTGNPFFTTDSASALRAAELGVAALLKGTRVDGVYTADPARDPFAVKYKNLAYDKALADNLKIMDLTAFALCKENKIPIVVFDMNCQGNLLKVIEGEDVGTVVS
ncbi:MAG: UMP kinase [Bacteroidales bacterium]|nr:UMP kinase [Bacteroidales bacterium]